MTCILLVGALGSRVNNEKFGVSGSSIILNCPIYGYPIENIVWEKGEVI